MTAKDHQASMIVEVNCTTCDWRDVYELIAWAPHRGCHCGAEAHTLTLQWSCSRCGANNLKGHTP